MTPFKPYLILALTLILYPDVRILAQTTRDTANVWTIDLEGLTLTGQSGRGAARFSIINTEGPMPELRVGVNLIQREAVINIADVIDRLPGLQIQKGALNTYRLNIRGVGARSPFATNRLTLYYGEIPLINGAGESAVEEWDPNLLGSIAYRRGPAPVGLGAGPGGALQIQLPGTSPYPFAFKAVAGSYGLWQTHAYAAPVSSPSGIAPLRISANHTHADGYRANNRYDRTSLLLAGTVGQQDSFDETNDRAIETKRLDYLLYGQHIRANIPSSLTLADFKAKPETAAANWAAVKGGEDAYTFTGGLTRKTAWLSGPKAAEMRTLTTVYGQLRTNDEVRPFNVLRENNLGGGVRFSLSRIPGQTADRWTYSAGLEVSGERYDQQTFETLPMGATGDPLDRIVENRLQYFLYAEGNIPLNRVKVEWGLNLKQNLSNWHFVNNPSDDLSAHSDPILSPQLGASFYLTRKQDLEWFGLVSSGAFWPGSESSYASGLRLDLLPERAWNLESGVRFSGAAVPGLEAELTAFRMTIDNLLAPIELPSGEPALINAGKSLDQGIELLVGQTWIRENPSLHTSLNYTVGDFTFLRYDGTGGNFEGNTLAGVAPIRAHLAADLGLPAGYYLHLNYDFTDKVYADDANTASAGAYGLLSFRAGWEQVLSNRTKTWYLHCNFFAGMENLADIRYAAMLQVNAAGATPRYYYPGLPRQFYLGASFRLAP
ncbi:MAG TPA: TonB-dependent receptor plug domain-containing protein [Flavilitoribacter sp.]|nr:TonB-dependent receptor plug domain-containing protein [Flavilitoribacter sp.]HMQ88289.1 TonB-dependent receptor plug domain-containing protein [Flavilitoribacter sp.]